jgi:hypothetical protein
LGPPLHPGLTSLLGLYGFRPLSLFGCRGYADARSERFAALDAT